MRKKTKGGWKHFVQKVCILKSDSFTGLVYDRFCLPDSIVVHKGSFVCKPHPGYIMVVKEQKC